MWGQELTLKALCKLLHVEVRSVAESAGCTTDDPIRCSRPQVRLVQNLRLQRQGQPPRIMFVSLDFSNEHGMLNRATVYLGLNQVAPARALCTFAPSLGCFLPMSLLL